MHKSFRNYILIISDLINSLELPIIQRKYLAYFIKVYSDWNNQYGKRDILYETLVYKIIYDFNNIKHFNVKIRFNRTFNTIKNKTCQMSKEILSIQILLCIKNQKVNLTC